ncbi:PAS domain-containing protein [Bradyrhizobium sp. 131]|uniref:PAS domain-containing protein n=2 Tax=unclassified Bradyrhizobium TaxID=2631580 RepID=UPI001FFF8F21|nr:PAS domain-containing protein [Bradyrhizobium sp. 131]MCK1417449.1 PAS domain S-box protein [Bradyrhizobium sp. CW4]MCK1430516.1 PAS domain S-box protein [Bradyrhizobium sp. 87]MCK1469060.1 PAS domain S-box protein [Bradyrhizobium sp. CW10]MCK1568759.1 PAS domain S-box protein [Bradyrhizobium sp. 173]UPK23370.1 PAS domain S-box protein [Bradyrhizobium sp. 131]
MAALLSSRLRFRTGLERALRDREARVRLLADNIADIVIVMDRKGYLRYVSPLVTVVGKTETDFLGRLCLDVVHEDDRERVLAASRELKGATASRFGSLSHAARRRRDALARGQFQDRRTLAGR